MEIILIKHIKNKGRICFSDSKTEVKFKEFKGDTIVTYSLDNKGILTFDKDGVSLMEQRIRIEPKK